VDAKEKFDTCQFRSLDEVYIERKSCCSDHSVRGFICWTRNIENVTPAQCDGCEQYLKKVDFLNPE
jgi:hypothetical protein